MSITLSTADLEQLRRAVEVLVSPLDHSHVDHWRSAVNRQLKELLYADSAGFLLPMSEALMVYSEEHDPDELASYPDLAPPDLSDGTPLWAQGIRSGVDTLANLYGRDYDRYLGSEYYNDYAGANGAHDTLFSVFSLGGMDARGTASLQLWHARPDGRLFGERETALLRLLFPAFRAGVETQVRWGRERSDLLNTLDGLGQAALVCDRSGRLVHMTPALTSTLEADPDVLHLRDQLLFVAQEVLRCAGTHGGCGGSPPGVPVRDVSTRSARYRLTGCLYGGSAAGGTTVAVVALERRTPALRSEEELRTAFSLTRAEVRVALLLAERKSNAEIAQSLFISPHTARRHTERILQKMNVHSRSEVGAKLYR